MQFNSLPFLYGFLPLFLIAYYLIREQFRSHLLVVGSFLFCWLAGDGNLLWVICLAVLTGRAYFASKSLSRVKSGWLLGFWLALFGGVLTFFKIWQGGRYLPAGMSFYLFQIAAILIDVYRNRVAGQDDPVKFAAGVVMFPKLLSGPIMAPAHIMGQENAWRVTWEQIWRGIEQLILGLALKVILANRLGGIWSQANLVGFENISTAYAWIAIVSWTMQLYFDFYGYSLMAMGLGNLLGYELPENFRTPYASGSVSEFYRRWHITLGAWFREYLYFPLGGSRRGELRTILNLAVVWLFTGLWHGVGGNYLIWAGFLLFLILNERLWLNRVLDKIGIFRHVYVVIAILFSWIPFAIGDFDRMIAFLAKLFGTGNTVNPQDYLALGSYVWMLAAGVLLATPVPEKLWKKIRNRPLGFAVLFVLFWVVVYLISTAAQDPFLYFQY